MILELDAGNSRIKWRLLNAGGGVESAGALAACEEPDGVVAALIDSLAHVGIQRPQAIRVASVRGAGFRSVLDDAMSRNFDLKPLYAQVTTHCAGLENSYEEPARMGVDRWLAMVAAWRDCGRGLCVVDAGSALTIDLVSPQGKHLGGYILPGLNMMLSSLSARSDALQLRHQPDWCGTAPGVDTHSAMEHGVLSMSVAMLERTNRLYPGLCWYLSGGDAPVLGACLDWDHSIRPDLVLDGLEAVLEQG